MQNICVRHGFPFYSKKFEAKKLDKEIMRKTKELKSVSEKISFLRKMEVDYWVPKLE
jgi:hypothetical protein